MNTAEGVSLRDEREFTPFAAAGWMSWDQWSPELDFCRFAGMLVRVTAPAVVVETGVGVGRLTAHLDTTSSVYLGFESDPAWRRPPALTGRETPTPDEMGSADLVVLDSEPSLRRREIASWAACGKPGSVCLVHDCGNGHPDHPQWTEHHRLRRGVEATGIPGLFLSNPRGGWLGWHP